MGYLYLALALAANITKGYCGKRTSGFAARYDDAILFMLLRMGFCLVIGVGVLAFQGEFSALAIQSQAVFPILLSGVTTVAFVISWLMSVRTGAILMLDVFMMMGMLITILLSWLFLNEPLGWAQLLGLALLLIAVLLMCSYNNSIKQKLTPAALGLLVLCGLSNGLTDFSQKLFTQTAGNTPVSVFNFYTYVIAAAVLGGLLLFRRRSADTGEHRFTLRPVFGYLLVMAVCLYAHSFFKTAASAYLPAVQLYPLHQGCSLLLSSLMASLIFKEKLTCKAIVGLVLAFLALLLINLK